MQQTTIVYFTYGELNTQRTTNLQIRAQFITETIREQSDLAKQQNNAMALAALHALALSFANKLYYQQSRYNDFIRQCGFNPYE